MFEIGKNIEKLYSTSDQLTKYDENQFKKELFMHHTESGVKRLQHTLQ